MKLKHEEIMSTTRFAVLPDERRVLMGVDKADIFEAGYVYEVHKIMEEIIIRKIGKYALAEKGETLCESSDNNTIMYYGNHLYTKEELKSIQDNYQK